MMTLDQFYDLSLSDKMAAAREMPNDELTELILTATNVVKLCNQLSPLYNELSDFDRKAKGLIASLKRTFSSKARENEAAKRKILVDKITTASFGTGHEDMEKVWKCEIDKLLAKYPTLKADDLIIRTISIRILSSNMNGEIKSVLVNEAEAR